MTFEEYQQQSRRTAQYPEIGHRVIYPCLGLAGESGEVLEKIKKIFRNQNGIFDAASYERIKKELGDVLWYLAQIATELGLSLEEIAQANLAKLADRQKRGVIKSSGDER